MTPRLHRLVVVKQRTGPNKRSTKDLKTLQVSLAQANLSQLRCNGLLQISFQRACESAKLFLPMGIDAKQTRVELQAPHSPTLPVQLQQVIAVPGSSSKHGSLARRFHSHTNLGMIHALTTKTRICTILPTLDDSEATPSVSQAVGITTSAANDAANNAATS